MRHRKREHKELCKPCSPREGKCCFENNPESCWFTHEDFQQPEDKEAPPIGIQSSKAKQMNQSKGQN